MASAADLKTRHTAALLNALVEHIHPKASLRVFSDVSRRVFEGTDQQLRREVSTASLGQALVRLHGERAADILSQLSARDTQVAKSVALMLLAIKEGHELQSETQYKIGQTQQVLRDLSISHQKSNRSLDPALQGHKLQTMRDFISALHGIQGHFLRENDESRAKILHKGEDAMIRHALVVGKVHLAVRQYATRLVTESSAGLVCQRLGHALRDELDGFDRFLSILEDHAFKDSGVHLAQLHAWSLGVSRKLNILWHICQSTEALRGGPLASALFAHTCVGDPTVSEVANRLLWKSYSPLEEIAKDFLHTGKLQLDTHLEFFVQRNRNALDYHSSYLYDDSIGYPRNNDSKELESYNEFVLNRKMIPTFLGETLAQKVLSTGAESKIARRLLTEFKYSSMDASSSDSESDSDIDEDMARSDIGSFFRKRLSTYVGKTERMANRTILDSLFKEHHLKDHLFALKQFLMLGQGDFGQLLVDQSFDLLSCPVEDVSRMELFSHVEYSVRNSNVPLEADDILSHLDIRLLDSINNASTAWDAFTLDYICDFPLNGVITPSCREKYVLVFQFLWRLKRVQHSLDITWKRHATHTRRSEQPPLALSRILHKSHLVRSEMMNFVTNLRSYVMFEVIETSWEQFNADLAEASSLGELLSAHETYLESVLLKAMIVEDSFQEDDFDQHSSFLTNNYASVPQTEKKKRFGAPMSRSPIFSIRNANVSYKETKGLSIRLNSLFDLVLKFCAVQDRLFFRIAEDYQARALRRRQKFDENRQARWMNSHGEDSKDDVESEVELEESKAIANEFGEQVDAIASEFWGSLGLFLSSLQSCSSESLRFLGLRLDFNRFY